MDQGELAVIEVLQFVFSSFWVWLGCVVILMVINAGIVGIFSLRK